MKTLDIVKQLGREKAVETLAASALREYGLSHEPVLDAWSLVLRRRKHSQESGRPAVIAALNNADTQGVLLSLLKTNADEVLQGICIAGYLLETDKMVLQLPEAARELAAELRAPADHYGIALAVGLVDVRAHENDIVSHLVTMKQLHDIFADCYTDTVYVSVNGAALAAVEQSAKLSDLLGDSLQSAKALQAGYHFYAPEAMPETVADADISNGVLCTLSQAQCVVAETAKQLEVLRKLSCGKCVFCREGLLQLHAMSKDILDGKGKMLYTDWIAEIGDAMTFSTLCSLGAQGANMILDTQHRFAGEYEAHIKKKTCPAGVCMSFGSIYIDPQLCEGCGDCLDVCPQNCIDGKAGFIHMIEALDCTKCGKCIEACACGAVVETTGRVPKLPDRLIKCGKFKRH